MAQRWLIKVNNGGFVFDGPTSRWSIRTRAQINDNGETDYFEHLVVVEGEIVPDPGMASADVAKNVTDKFKALRSYLMATVPLALQLELDGNVEYSFSPVDSIGGPKAREIVQLPVGADHATHVRFTATFFIKQLARLSGGNAGAVDLFREVREVSYKGEVQQKIWHARCRAQTLSQAKAIVMRFRPTAAPLTEDLSERIDLNEFEAIWTWDKTAQGISQFSEVIDGGDAGFPWIEDPIVGTGDEGPVFHKARRRAGTLRITMTLRGDDPTKLARPALHLTEGSGIHRDVTQERNQPPVLEDAMKGIWRAVWQEYWIYRNAKLPPLNHVGHANPIPAPPVPNGPIGGSQSAKIALQAGG